MADIFTDVGETFVADLFDGTASAPANYYVGWGTGAGTAAKADTTLSTEAAESRVAATMTQPSANINQAVAQITATGSKTITNAGLFDASTVGNLIVHGDHGGIAVVSGDKIEYTIQITWS
jgi:hypothetical protein